MDKLRYMLDTNMASSVIRGPVRTLAERLLSVPNFQLCVSAVTQAELLYGVARRPDPSNLRIAVKEFLARLDILAWDSEAAIGYGTLCAALEGCAKPLGNLDTMIAAHALSVDAILVTNDKAFKRVPGLVIEDWLLP